VKRAPLTAEAIIADAADLADEAGFDEVTLSEVARRLGVRTPSLYSHVRDLAALRDGISALALSELGDRISLGIAGRSGRLALRGLAEAHRAFARESPGRWQSLLRRAGASGVGSEAARRVVALTDAVLLGYGLPPEDRVHAIRLIGSTIAGFLVLERVGSFSHRPPASEVSWQKAIDALDVLLHAWPAEAEPREPP